jgi:molybdopterin molybdotransferase
VAVGATGDELVPAAASAAPWQVRNSNGPLLVALAAASGAQVTDLGILPDRAAALTAAIAAARRSHDLVLLSGGVSRGDLDLVTGALPAAGLLPVFHGVAVKPGKPILFAAGGDGTYALGLPGNPLSALVGFLLFVAPALARLAGRPAQPAVLAATLVAGVSRRVGDRAEYLPAQLWADADGRLRAQAATVASSADLGAAAGANALLRLPVGNLPLAAGATVEVLQPPPLAGIPAAAGA